MTTYSKRLSSTAADAIQEYSTNPKFLGSKKLFPITLRLFKSHGVMLGETGIIKRDDAAAILKELVNIEQAGFEAFPLQADIGDIYLNIQMQLMKRLGDRVGGWLHIAISRNDFFSTQDRLYARELINRALKSMLVLMDSVLNLAKQHVYTVMPGYTHMTQPAQPITFAHYLLAYYDAFTRDIERFEHAYQVVNRSTMGGCALATTGFPIDRQRVSDLIGCNHIVENSLDGTGGRDVLMQTGSDAAIAFSTMGRLVEHLLLWNTLYFGMVELADQFCGISSIMPQKKNPIGLEMLRGESVRVHSLLEGAFGILKALPVGAGGEPKYATEQIFEATEKLIYWAPVLANILDTLKINVDVMLARASDGYSTMTELADTIVRNTNLSYHESYVIVSQLVVNLSAAGQKADVITTGMIDEISNQLYKMPLNLPAETVKRALDPVENVNVRDRTGGPAPVEVERMLKVRFEQQASMKAQLQKHLDDLNKADQLLNGALAQITG